MDREGTVYIVTNTRNGTLYLGVTSNLTQRIWQHREGVFEGFTKDNGLKRLVWYQTYPDMQTAIAREKAMKAWKRNWKMRVIEEMNPDWTDLWPTLFGEGLSAEAWLANYEAEHPN